MNFTTLLVTILCASHVCSHIIHRRQADPTNDPPPDNDGATGATGGTGDGAADNGGQLVPIISTHDTGPDGFIIPGSNRTVIIPDVSTAYPETTDDGSNGGGVTDLPGDSGYGSGDSGYGSGDSGYGSGDSGYGTGDSGYGPGDSGYGPGDSGYGPGDSGYGPGDSGYGPGDSGYEPGVSDGPVAGHEPSGRPWGTTAPSGW